jgi:hypothetical protein
MLHQRCASDKRTYLKILTNGSAFTNGSASEGNGIRANTDITEMDLNRNGSPSFDVASWKEQIIDFRAFEESLFFGDKHD